MTIREANNRDFNTIQNIANIVWPATFGPLMSEELLHYMIDLMYSSTSLKKQIEIDGIKYLIIELNNKAIGYCSYEINYLGEQKLMMHRLYILPKKQGEGVGTKILDHLCEIGKQHQQKSICLKVLHSNTKAYQYYLKYGFIKTGEDYNHIGNNYPPFLDYILEKDF